MTTEDDEFDARVEAELDAAIEADVQAEKAKKRAEIAAQLRHKAAMAHLDKVNARHPIEGPGDPKFEAERRRVMAERARPTACSASRHLRWPCLKRDSLLKRELMFPAVAPRRSAISFDVSPFGDPCSIAIMRPWKLLIIAVVRAKQSAI
jgi:hypothetical protein